MQSFHSRQSDQEMAMMVVDLLQQETLTYRPCCPHRQNPLKIDIFPFREVTRRNSQSRLNMIKVMLHKTSEKY